MAEPLSLREHDVRLEARADPLPVALDSGTVPITRPDPTAAGHVARRDSWDAEPWRNTGSKMAAAGSDGLWRREPVAAAEDSIPCFA